MDANYSETSLKTPDSAGFQAKGILQAFAFAGFLSHLPPAPHTHHYPLKLLWTHWDKINTPGSPKSKAQKRGRGALPGSSGKEDPACLSGEYWSGRLPVLSPEVTLALPPGLFSVRHSSRPSWADCSSWAGMWALELSEWKDLNSIGPGSEMFV